LDALFDIEVHMMRMLVWKGLAEWLMDWLMGWSGLAYIPLRHGNLGTWIADSVIEMVRLVWK